jgi:cytochrome c peroxidase
MGTLGSYFDDKKAVTRGDLGRYNVTEREEDRHLFKVPSLRLAAKNPPYLHDGSADSLDQAIQIMVRHQLGRTISEGDVRLINSFLHSLVGEHPRIKP